MDDGLGGDLISLIGYQQDVLQTTLTISEGIIKGRDYKFIYRCKNVNGWSAFSGMTYIKAAIQPSRPLAPTLILATAKTMSL